MKRLTLILMIFLILSCEQNPIISDSYDGSWEGYFTSNSSSNSEKFISFNIEEDKLIGEIITVSYGNYYSDYNHEDDFVGNISADKTFSCTSQIYKYNLSGKFVTSYFEGYYNNKKWIAYKTEPDDYIRR